MNKNLPSEKVVITAPMSFSGSAARIWKLTYVDNVALRAVLIIMALGLIVVAWAVVLCWYLLFGLLLVPYRLIRRSSRKNRRDKLRHQEILEAIDQNKR